MKDKRKATSHTPIPWSVYDQGLSLQIFKEDDTDDGEDIVETPIRKLGKRTLRVTNLDRANVDLIVKAVNNHESLVEVLREFVQDVDVAGESALEDWPDLAITHHKAVDLLSNLNQ